MMKNPYPELHGLDEIGRKNFYVKFIALITAYGGQPPQQPYGQQPGANNFGGQWGAVPPATQPQSPTVPQAPPSQAGYGTYGQSPAAPGAQPYGTQPPPYSLMADTPPLPLGDYSVLDNDQWLLVCTM